MNDNASVTAIGLPTPNSDWQSLPRLRIYHFFIWTAAAAVGMALLRQSNEVKEVPQAIVTEMQFHSVFQTITGTIALTTFGMVWLWRQRVEGVTMEPGHWLLAFLSLSCIGNLILSIGLTVIPDSAGAISYLYVLSVIVSAIASIGIFIVVVIAFRKVCDPAWRRCFLVMCLSFSAVIFVMIAACGGLPYQYLHYIFLPFTLAQGVFMALAVRNDWMKGQRRHWSHWCGVICFGLPLLLSLLAYLPFWR